jgi:hypothetical protein
MAYKFGITSGMSSLVYVYSDEYLRVAREQSSIPLEDASVHSSRYGMNGETLAISLKVGTHLIFARDLRRSEPVEHPPYFHEIRSVNPSFFRYLVDVQGYTLVQVKTTVFMWCSNNPGLIQTFDTGTPRLWVDSPTSEDLLTLFQ